MNAQTTHQAVTTQQNALQAALGRANEKANEKSNNVAPITATGKDSVVSIVPRSTILGERLVFLPASVDYEKSTIDYWDMKKGSKLRSAPLEFYRMSKPLDDQEEAVSIGSAFAKEFGHAHIHSRQRLVKKGSLERADDGSVNKRELDAWKQKLISEITRVIMEL